MMELFRYQLHYEMEIENEKITIMINRPERALKCHKCKSFKCKHIIIIWKDEQEKNYLEKKRLHNPLKYLV